MPSLELLHGHAQVPGRGLEDGTTVLWVRLQLGHAEGDGMPLTTLGMSKGMACNWPEATQASTVAASHHTGQHSSNAT
jgi:hypothetical protein